MNFLAWINGFLISATELGLLIAVPFGFVAFIKKGARQSFGKLPNLS